LRGLAKKGLLKSSNDPNLDVNQEALTLPVTLAKLTEIFLDNQQLVLEEYSSDPGIPFHISVLTEYQQKYSTYFLEQEQFVVFNDTNKESQLVYGILVNNSLKRITLVFRGSVTTMDYKMDFKIGMDKLVADGGNDGGGKGRKVFVHRGFSTYLLDPKHNSKIPGESGGNTGEPGCGESKFDEIKRELDKCSAKYPDHRLYVTGHSLGGSLALIAAFQLAPSLTYGRPLKASSPDTTGDGVGGGISINTPRPLTNITFGPLQVGDIRFRQEFASMECEGLINNLNIVNRGDLIPLYPVWTGTRWYRFVGNKMKLANQTSEDLEKKSKNERLARKIERIKMSTISRAPETNSCFMAWLRDVPNQIKYTGMLFRVLLCERSFWLNHTVTETSVNLKANADLLKLLTWDELYKESRPTASSSGKVQSHGRASFALPKFVGGLTSSISE